MEMNILDSKNRRKYLKIIDLLSVEFIQWRTHFFYNQFNYVNLSDSANFTKK